MVLKDGTTVPTLPIGGGWDGEGKSGGTTYFAVPIDLEQVDMAEAISSYTWQGYAYNAALKVGTDIVSQSLLDFMR